MRHWICDETGAKLQSFLKRALSGAYSGRHIKRLIDRNHCRVNGQIERFGNTPLKRGDNIELILESQKVESPKILFQDEAIVVCDKPAGRESGAVARLLEAQLVHRLDRDTGGVMVLAKSCEARSALEEQFRRGLVTKRYLAVVDGCPSEREGIVRNRLGPRVRYSGQTIYGPVQGGRLAITEWSLLDVGEGCSLVACFPKTGRTHQIRVHLAGLGHPVLGDGQYGRHASCSHRATRHLLHAEQLEFLHPLTNTSLTFSSPKPKDFPL